MAQKQRAELFVVHGADYTPRCSGSAWSDTQALAAESQEMRGAGAPVLACSPRIQLAGRDRTAPTAIRIPNCTPCARFSVASQPVGNGDVG